MVSTISQISAPSMIFLWVVLQTIAYTSAYSVTICNPILTRLLVST